MWELDCEESWAPKNWCFWTVLLEKTRESPMGCKEIQPVHPKGDQSWVFIGRTDAEAETNTLVTLCKVLTHWKRRWCWEGLGAVGEGDDRGWDGWRASLTWWTWVWVNSGSWWWTGRPGVLWFMGLQRVGHDWATELNWLNFKSLALMAPFNLTLEYPFVFSSLSLGYPTGTSNVTYLKVKPVLSLTCLVPSPLHFGKWHLHPFRAWCRHASPSPQQPATNATLAVFSDYIQDQATSCHFYCLHPHFSPRLLLNLSN